MTSFLNAYRNFINISTKEGLTLLSNATDKFDCPLKGDKRISLRSGGHDYQKLKDIFLCCSQCFGYQHLLNNVPSTWVVTPAVPAVLQFQQLQQTLLLSHQFWQLQQFRQLRQFRNRLCIRIQSRFWTSIWISFLTLLRGMLL
jgi:hypothetical protein